MVLAFTFLIPVAVALLRSGARHAFTMHWVVQIGALITAISSFVLAWAKVWGGVEVRGLLCHPRLARGYTNWAAAVADVDSQSARFYWDNRFDFTAPATSFGSVASPQISNARQNLDLPCPYLGGKRFALSFLG